ncbi:MAG: pyridoxamine 5'-phosphate oxidase family protein [Candidatus Thorarchaeota archaeon]|nr:pyridoxamine 5'-phosphate oxidase family protein [Candidatus Thorarchaeota archaeon]
MREIRRRERAITERNEMVEILESVKYVTIAMCADSMPYLVTLSHGYDRERHCIYFHCAKEGKKIGILNSNSIVWGQALLDKGYVQGDCDHFFATVQFKGRVTFIDSLVEKKHALRVMIECLEDNPSKVIAAKIKDSAVQELGIGRIDIEYLSGKKAEKADASA